MLISDWISDVCSSDLARSRAGLRASTDSMVTSSPGATSMPCSRYSGLNATVSSVPSNLASIDSWAWPTSWVTATSSGPSDRKSVVYGKSVSVRVDLGGRRHIQKNQTRNKQKNQQQKQ